jgi:membrane protein DedA with SNARE-associated domain
MHVTASNFASGIVDHLGVTGIGVGVFLNGIGVPGLSEVLLPLGGVAVRQGQLNLPTLFLTAMVCQVAGLSLAYAIARYGGIALVERYGKYILVSTRELDAANKAFDKYGEWMVLFGAFVPGIQGFVGYIAGFAKMNFWRFLISATIGKLVWVGGLLYLGFVLGDHLDLIDRSIKQIGVLVLAALVLIGIWYVRRHRNSKTGRSREEK